MKTQKRFTEYLLWSRIAYGREAILRDRCNSMPEVLDSSERWKRLYPNHLFNIEKITDYRIIFNGKSYV